MVKSAPTDDVPNEPPTQLQSIRFRPQHQSPNFLFPAQHGREYPSRSFRGLAACSPEHLGFGSSDSGQEEAVPQKLTVVASRLIRRAILDQAGAACLLGER
jgi:hypothetical protein